MSRPVNAKRFSAVMRDLARVPSQASAAIARDISREIQRGFDAGCDPYGKTWKRLAKSTLARGRHPPPLTDTREGRESVRVVPLPSAGIKLIIGKLYMVYHTRPIVSPRRRFPVRQFVPEDRLPDKWGAIAVGHIEALGQKVIDRG